LFETALNRVDFPLAFELSERNADVPGEIDMLYRLDVI